MKKLLLLILAILSAPSLPAQQWSAKSYTVDDGLPGNNLSGIVRDGRGFYWMGSENGLGRFDGNRFRSYRVSDGLADNEITSLCRDAQGIVWALPYRKLPAYYDPETDRFISIPVRELPRPFLPGREISMQPLASGGVALHAAGGDVLIFRKNENVLLETPRHTLHAARPWLTIDLGGRRFVTVAQDSLRIYEGSRFAGGSRSPQRFNNHTVCLGRTLFSSDSAGIYKTELDRSGAVVRQIMKPLPLHDMRLSSTGRGLALISHNGTSAALVDTGSLAISAGLPLEGALAAHILEEADGRIWIATIGQGLIKWSRHPVISYNHLLPPDMSPVAVAVDGPTLLCGDNKGRIVIIKSGCVEKIINISKWSKAVSRIRNILVLRDGYYIAVEGDASLLLDKHYNIVSVYNRPLLNYTDRCAALWRDSIILAGSHERAVRLNYRACRGYDSIPIRTTAIGADQRGRLLIGSADGFYRLDDTGLYAFGKGYSHTARRVNDICMSADKLIWVGLASGHIAAIKGDTIAGIIAIGKTIPGNTCNTLFPGKDGQLWVGTDRSLTRLQYAVVGGRLKWTASAFGAMDGLPGQVNDIVLQGDSIYIASTAGLYTLPTNTQLRVDDLPVYLTGIRINDQDTVLKKDWSLPYYLNNWDISFAGIDPAGFAPSFEYRINRDDWQPAGEGHLMLSRLSPGDYRVEIRALRRDGSPSPGTASLRIYLQPPFWQSSWLWLAVFFLLLGGAALVLQGIFKRKKEKHLRQVAAEHELVTSQQQTFSALMNPHFIFNALNSIQHYVLVHDKRSANRYLSGFGRLIRMNFESAQQSYITLEEELERLQLYLSLEQMRFGDKLSYTIEVDDDVAPEDWKIPAMIIQPYLENALLHGITPAKNEGLLQVRISRSGDSLQVTICDNGIGMANSMQLRRQGRHVSRSMELIRKRIAILQKLHQQSISIETRPWQDDSTHPGTLVVMTFKGHYFGN